jgi:hypothetical protein
MVLLLLILFCNFCFSLAQVRETCTNDWALNLKGNTMLALCYEIIDKSRQLNYLIQIKVVASHWLPVTSKPVGRWLYPPTLEITRNNDESGNIL